VVASGALQFDRVFKHQHPIASAGNLGEQRIGQRGFTGLVPPAIRMFCRSRTISRSQAAWAAVIIPSVT